MATFKITIFTTKNHIKSDGTTNIKIRIYHNKESLYLSTPYYIEPNYLNNSGNISSLCPNADNLNYELGEIIQLHKRNYIKLGSLRSSQMTCSELKDYLIYTSEPQLDYIDFVEFSRETINKTKKLKTKEWYDTSIKSLCKYWKRDKINIRDITALKLNEYIEYLYCNGLQPGGINNYLRGLRSLFNKCKEKFNNEDYDLIPIPHDPFKRIKIPDYQRKRKSIPIETVKKLRDLELINEREIIARDMFMIMFYLMGINVNDLYQLFESRGGRIEYMRSKTNTFDNSLKFLLSIKIEPELKILIDKYSSGNFLSIVKKRYCCPYNFMKAINKGLKIICENNKIPKITTNWARHSWASIARNKAGIPKADVDFCLGHVNNDYKMADIYIDIDYSIYDKSNRLVLDLLK